MKITLIRAEKESRKEALSTLEADALIKKLKTETKAGHVSTLRAVLPQPEGTCAQYEHIDKLPRIYPAVEYSRTQEGERWMKNYNGLVQPEVNRLSGIAEAEYVKQQAALLPQTFAAFCGSKWTECQNMDIVCPARRHDAEAGERCHLVSCPRLPYGGEVLPALAAVCHYIERTFPYPELPHDSGRISILQSCRCAFLPGTAPQHARGRELPATKTRRKRTRCCGCIRTVKPRTPLPYSSSRPLTVHSADWAAGNGTGIYGYCWCLWPNIVSRQAFPKRK